MRASAGMSSSAIARSSTIAGACRGRSRGVRSGAAVDTSTNTCMGTCSNTNAKGEKV